MNISIVTQIPHFLFAIFTMYSCWLLPRKSHVIITLASALDKDTEDHVYTLDGKVRVNIDPALTTVYMHLMGRTPSSVALWGVGEGYATQIVRLWTQFGCDQLVVINTEQCKLFSCFNLSKRETIKSPMKNCIFKIHYFKGFRDILSATNSRRRVRQYSPPNRD